MVSPAQESDKVFQYVRLIKPVTILPPRAVILIRTLIRAAEWSGSRGVKRSLSKSLHDVVGLQTPTQVPASMSGVVESESVSAIVRVSSAD